MPQYILTLPTTGDENDGPENPTLILSPLAAMDALYDAIAVLEGSAVAIAPAVARDLRNLRYWLGLATPYDGDAEYDLGYDIGYNDGERDGERNGREIGHTLGFDDAREQHADELSDAAARGYNEGYAAARDYGTRRQADTRRSSSE